MVIVVGVCSKSDYSNDSINNDSAIMIIVTAIIVIVVVIFNNIFSSCSIMII